MSKRRSTFFAWAASCLVAALLFAAVALLFTAWQRPVLAVSLEYHPGPLAPELRVVMTNRGHRAIDLPAAWRVVSVPPGPYGDIHELHLLPRSASAATPAAPLVPGATTSSADLLPLLPAGADIAPIRARATLDSLPTEIITIRRER